MSDEKKPLWKDLLASVVGPSDPERELRIARLVVDGAEKMIGRPYTVEELLARATRAELEAEAFRTLARERGWKPS